MENHLYLILNTTRNHNTNTQNIILSVLFWEAGIQAADDNTESTCQEPVSFLKSVV